MESYKEALSRRNRAETGIRYEWYALQRWGANYSDDFSKQKIVWGNLCQSAQFALADERFFINAPATMIVPGDRYLLALLNSKLADFYIRTLGVTRSGGYFEYKPMFIEKFPAISISGCQRDNIIYMCDQLLKTKKTGGQISEIEHELDVAICVLYNLDEQERNLLLCK